MKVAALGDLHIAASSKGVYHDLFLEISKNADVLLICGDLTNSGSVEEGKAAVAELKVCTIPVIGVLGNHDYDSNAQDQITELLHENNVMKVLDGKWHIKDGVGFAGTKGYSGGFDKFMLAAFGEDATKSFVNVVVQEALKLERALSQLDTEKKVVLLHYSPIRDTVLGESPEIFTYMGSSRLVRPIENFTATVVFHGHAHHGSQEGKTILGIPVFNVSYPLLQKKSPKKPYVVYEV